jgi:hypothetical protein
MRKPIILVVMIATMMIAPRAWGGPITTWTLTSVTFSDGSTATGFFIDPAGGTLTPQFLSTGQWSITVTAPAGSNFSPFTYNSSNSTARLINDPPGSPVPGAGLEVDTTALCTDTLPLGGTGTGFCRDIILDSPFLDPNVSSVPLSTTFSVEGCTGCAPGMLNDTRGFSAGTLVSSAGGGTATAPEPSSLALLLCGLGVFAVVRRLS